MPRRGRDSHRKTTPHSDGLKEGVLNDPTGIQYGIEVGHDKVINPADISKMVNEKSVRNQKK